MLKSKTAPKPARSIAPTRRFENIPSRFKDELCFYILAELGNGRSLGEVCLEPGMPSAGIVAGWALRDQAFAKLYIHARRKRAIVFAEQIVEIADDDFGDDKIKIARATLRIKTRQWLVERDLAELFGDFKERELKPLPVLNSVNATAEELKMQISNDPTQAAREYQKIMSATSAGAAFVASTSDPSTIDEDGNALGAENMRTPEMRGYVSEDVAASVDPEYVPNDDDEEEAESDDTETDRPKMADHYDPKRPPAIEGDYDDEVEPDQV